MAKEISLRNVKVTRYIVPLREGGSLPALAEADDGFKYVLKFRGAGHGTKMLISELLGGMIASALGLQIPELVFASLDEEFGRTEGDEEIQDLLRGSQGINLGLHFLSGSVNFDPVVTNIDADQAALVVWLDAFLTNIDRTFRNTNMLIWNKELWLIDHGASLYFHHSWSDWEKAALSNFAYVKDHVLLPRITSESMDKADKVALELLSPKTFEKLLTMLPEEWLKWEDVDLNPDEIRKVYLSFLTTRLQHSENFTKEAKDAAARL